MTDQQTVALAVALGDALTRAAREHLALLWSEKRNNQPPAILERAIAGVFKEWLDENKAEIVDAIVAAVHHTPGEEGE